MAPSSLAFHGTRLQIKRPVGSLNGEMLDGRSPCGEGASFQGAAHGGKLDAIAPSKGRGCQKQDPVPLAQHGKLACARTCLWSRGSQPGSCAHHSGQRGPSPVFTTSQLPRPPGCLEHSLGSSTVFSAQALVCGRSTERGDERCPLLFCLCWF